MLPLNLSRLATITKFEELEVWQLARELAKEIFELFSNSEQFSRDYKLKDQINGSSGSVMDNIAEGFERGGKNEFVHFLSISKGSCGELRSQIYRALDRNYISESVFEKIKKEAEDISGMLQGLINYLNKSEIKGTKFKDRV